MVTVTIASAHRPYAQHPRASYAARCVTPLASLLPLLFVAGGDGGLPSPGLILAWT
jgi:hypothetical protein